MIREMRESDAPGVAQVMCDTAPGWVISAREVLHRLSRIDPRDAGRMLAELQAEKAAEGSTLVSYADRRERSSTPWTPRPEKTSHYRPFATWLAYVREPS